MQCDDRRPKTNPTEYVNSRAEDINVEYRFIQAFCKMTT